MAINSTGPAPLPGVQAVCVSCDALMRRADEGVSSAGFTGAAQQQQPQRSQRGGASGRVDGDGDDEDEFRRRSRGAMRRWLQRVRLAVSTGRWLLLCPSPPVLLSITVLCSIGIGVPLLWMVAHHTSQPMQQVSVPKHTLVWPSFTAVLPRRDAWERSLQHRRCPALARAASSHWEGVKRVLCLPLAGSMDPASTDAFAYAQVCAGTDWHPCFEVETLTSNQLARHAGSLDAALASVWGTAAYFDLALVADVVADSTVSQTCRLLPCAWIAGTDDRAAVADAAWILLPELRAVLQRWHDQGTAGAASALPSLVHVPWGINVPEWLPAKAYAPKKSAKLPERSIDVLFLPAAPPGLAAAAKTRNRSLRIVELASSTPSSSPVQWQITQLQSAKVIVAPRDTGAPDLVYAVASGAVVLAELPSSGDRLMWSQLVDQVVLSDHAAVFARLDHWLGNTPERTRIGFAAQRHVLQHMDYAVLMDAFAQALVAEPGSLILNSHQAGVVPPPPG